MRNGPAPGQISHLAFIKAIGDVLTLSSLPVLSTWFTLTRENIPPGRQERKQSPLAKDSEYMIAVSVEPNSPSLHCCGPAWHLLVWTSPQPGLSLRGAGSGKVHIAVRPERGGGKRPLEYDLDRVGLFHLSPDKLVAYLLSLLCISFYRSSLLSVFGNKQRNRTIILEPLTCIQQL